MTFEVKGESWSVSRNNGKDVLYDADGTVAAVGADAVNKKVVEIFGYGLEVFDVANACTQSEVTAISKMSPASRKAMVDGLLGLDTLEAIEKACREEAKGVTREVDALLSTLPPLPVAPVEPVGYEPAVELAAELEVYRNLMAARNRTLAVQAAVGAAPTAPTERLSSEALEAHETDRLGALSFRSTLQQRLDAIPVTDVTPEEIAAAEAHNAYFEEEMRRGPRPTMDPEPILDQWARYEASQHAVTCPECSATFVPGAGTVDKVEMPTVGKAEARAEQKAVAAWATPLEPVPYPARPLTLQQLRTARAALDGAAERERLLVQLAAIDTGVDKSGELAEARANERAWQVYEQMLASYVRRRDEAAMLTLPDDVSNELTDVARRLDEARSYEAALARYDSDLARHSTLSADIEARKVKAAGFAAGVKALKDVRVEFRTHIAPEIGRLASQLIDGMTGGEFNSIEVTGDFEITVNNQPLHTLSGSEAAVANLALRIGLGQVLTSRVFPVFIGDEIDASFDDERVEYTANAFRGLANVLRQVVLVSHKSIESDQVVSL